MRNLRKILLPILLAAATTQANAEVLIGVQQERSVGAEHAKLTIVYENKGSSSVSIPFNSIPNTLKDGRLLSDSFQIRAIDGTTPAYRGINVNLTQDARREVVVLAPGENKTVTIDISASYDLRSGMTYRISPPGVRYQENESTSTTPPQEGARNYIYAPAPFIDIVAPKGESRATPQSGQARKITSAATRCAPDKLRVINEAMPVARKLAADAKSYLDSLYGFEETETSIIATFRQTPRYTSWFGIHGNPNIVNPVNITVREIIGATATRFGMLQQPSCECPTEIVNRVNAWTTPGINYLINYCPNFFSLPNDVHSESGSKAVTIYHEISHFDDFLAKGTDDYDANFALPSEASDLARTDRDLAAEHSYGLEYFAKNAFSEE